MIVCDQEAKTEILAYPLRSPSRAALSVQSGAENGDSD